MPKILITGGNKGIGFATTTCFLQNGYDIVIIARDFSAFPLHETHVQQVRFDLRHYRDIPRVVNEIGAIDILVNNAGILQSCWCRHPEVHRWGYATHVSRLVQLPRCLSSRHARDIRPSGIRSATPTVWRPIVRPQRSPSQRGGIAACRLLLRASASVGATD